ncbi:carboxylating nicotinate-nucleotide diphosphorylase [Magnetospira sp. QH-2]|uniref:carboxylating nicotinate-nucleotide diphosphorylase n=1 Tax=Magnetospira sp. (strain QH-2) TaxID=1288970 RepID=UPI0003E8186C|nr:carboxylating nicotinate-nucleotide diphosphorylase [Magnetospira sp. QH-2]CCQ73403.1 Quinolinate phosphoribosyltransferase (nicotinate-nucleotide pyrophosphorylase) [Magnetospira sp. QH-2]
MSLDPEIVAQVIDFALGEDVGGGDVTSAAVIPKGARFAGTMTARHDMVIAGLGVAKAVVHRLSPDAHFETEVQDGDRVAAGQVLARMAGPAHQLLAAERSALNLLQFMSGIATQTRSYVDRIEGTGATLLDTRKTVPGLRDLSKYATRMGGAQNHRMRLDDGILIKDNHIAVAGGVTECVRRAKAADSGLTIEVECDTLDQVREAVEAGAHMLLLDNMPPEVLRQALQIVDGRAKTEASGGVTLDSIRAIAETGVDYISVGRITQSAPAVDIGLDWSAA